MIVIDMLKVLERHDIHDEVDSHKWKCSQCGRKLEGSNGLIISSVRHIGRWPEGKTMVMPARESVPSF